MVYPSGICEVLIRAALFSNSSKDIPASVASFSHVRHDSLHGIELDANRKRFVFHDLIIYALVIKRLQQSIAEIPDQIYGQDNAAILDGSLVALGNIRHFSLSLWVVNTVGGQPQPLHHLLCHHRRADRHVGGRGRY